MVKKDELAVKEEQAMSVATEVPLGFEDDTPEDMIIPRIKVCSALTPEVREKTAEEGDIINSLTGDKYNGKVFIPISKFNSNIAWRERRDGGGIECRAFDGKNGQDSNGICRSCAQCRRNEFDNTKQGKDSYPTCTKYLNFLGWIRDEPMPVILSFAKTNYGEGKKLYSMAKVARQNMWHFGYTLESKQRSKAGNEWFIIDVASAGPTTDEERTLGMEFYQSFAGSMGRVNYDVEERQADIPPMPVATDDELPF